MIKKINNARGQTALILILLAAGALIFLAITLNWGRIAQTKSLLSIAADQSGALLASDAASYGEMQKQQYLNDQNQLSDSTGFFLTIFAVILAVLVTILCPPAGAVAWWIAGAAIAMAAANLVLQLVVVQPMITNLWNKLQKNQPIQQQFFEQGISTALQGAVTDQVNITDYFDWNANGQFGNNANSSPNDIVGRFALFYSDRLKMLNTDQPSYPEILNFQQQLGELINGSTASPMPLSIQCTDVNNPYCNPCCVPASVKDPSYCPDASQACSPNPMHPTPYKIVRPSSCGTPAICATDPGSDPNCGVPEKCIGANNPYGPSYPYLYDPAYQDYMSKSFLAQFGRDMQLGPFTQGNVPLLSVQGNFPNGVFPYFWLMKDYSPEVDDIDPANLQPSQYHWCDKTITPPYTAPHGYASLSGDHDLDQLDLSTVSNYICQGKDCCVGHLGGTLTNANSTVANNSSGNNNYLSGGPTNVPAPINLNTNAIDMAGSSADDRLNPALDERFGLVGATRPTWIEGDNQLCSTTWTYNGSSATIPDGTCELTGSTSPPTAPLSPPVPGETIDGLDYAQHTLSDFVNFSKAFLSIDVGTLNSTFDSWYPQVAQWVSPNGPSQGSVASLPSYFNILSTVMATWLNIGTPSGVGTYANANAWCVPSSTDGLSAEEITAINGVGNWGSLPSVIACLKYNSTFPINNYQKCLTDLQTMDKNQKKDPNSTACGPVIPPSCDPLVLGRSLAGQAPQFIPSVASPPASVNNCPNSASQCTVAPTSTSVAPGPGLGSTTTDVSVTTCACDSLVISCPSCCNTTPTTCSGDICSVCGKPCSGGGCTNTTTTNIFQSASCDATVANTYANWVQNSLTLATDAAPKFKLRAQYLDDVYGRAQVMPTLFSQGASELGNFISGPAAALDQVAQTQQAASKDIPNSIIYGWVDKMPNSSEGGCFDSKHQKVGCAHIVKATVYSPGRGGSISCINDPTTKNPSCTKLTSQQLIWSSLPWIKTTTGVTYNLTSGIIGGLLLGPIGWLGGIDLTRYYTLTDRDGYVYVSVKRWDEDHSNTTNFPNNHLLWQFMFHNPKANATNGNTGTQIGGGSIGACAGINGGNGNNIGFGLQSTTVAGLLSPSAASITPVDLKALGHAFMLNDKGDGNGTIDNTIKSGSSTQAQTVVANYKACLQTVNSLLGTAPESHACLQYLASTNAVGNSGTAKGCSSSSDGITCDTDYDYSLKFVDCNTIDGGHPPPEDLTGQ